MSVKGYTRAQLNELCLHLSETIQPGASFSTDVPTPLIYGQDGDPGATGKLIHSNHRHALDPSIFGAVPTFGWDAKSGTGGAGLTTQFKLLQETPGNQVTNAPDDVGNAGAFGVDRITFGAIAPNGTGHIVQAQDTLTAGATGNTTDRNHSVQRMKGLVTRIRALVTAGTALGNRTFIGGFHETVNQDLTSLDDALGFWIQVDGAGLGNFLAYAQSSTTGLTSTFDTGITWRANQYMKFEIQYDLTTAFFLIDDALVAALSTNIPTQKVFGWGLTTRKEASTNFTELMFDDWIFKARR